MGNISRTFALILIGVIAFSILTLSSVKYVNAETPPIPEFTVKFVDGSYDIPANTSIDPFTGQALTNPAQHINNQTIVLTIKYQTNLYQENELYFQVQMKGHYSQEWTNLSHVEANPHSEYTVATYAVAGNNASGHFDDYLNQIKSDGTIDYRIYAQTWVQSSNPYQMPMIWVTSVSDWSNIQTVTIPTNPSGSSASMPSLSPTSSIVNTTASSNQELTNITFTIAVIVLAVAVVSLLMYVKKIKSRINQPSK
jgi:hypothetical protein